METRLIKKTDQEIMVQLSQYLINSGESANFESIQRLASDDRSYLFALIEDAELIGYTLAYRFPSLYNTKDLAYLYDVDVAPAFRNRGYGKQLITSLLAHLQPEGVEEVWLGTSIDNAHAQKLFESTGGLKSGVSFFEYFYTLSEIDKPE